MSTAMPDTGWRIRQSRRRLAVTLVLSALAIGTALFLLSLFPPPDSVLPGPGPLDVTLQQQENAEPPAPAESVETETQPEKVAEEPLDVVSPESLAEDATDDAPAVESAPDRPRADWYGALDNVASRSDEFKAKTPSMSPDFDELRRIAAVRYAEPRFERKKPIWENVEKDMLGRTILRHGDCHRVLDDPSVVNQWVNQNFTQYLVFCSKGAATPKDLPWVKEIVARYGYLQDRNEAADRPADHSSGAYLANTSASVIDGKSPENP